MTTISIPVHQPAEVEMWRTQHVTRMFCRSRFESIAPYLEDGWYVTAVDKIPVMGCCEKCGYPIVDGQIHEKRLSWKLGCPTQPLFTCKDCMFTPKPLSRLLIPERTA